VLASSGHLHGSALDLLQQLCISPEPEAPGLDSVLQMGPQNGRAKWDNHLLPSAGHPSSDAAPDTFGFSGLKRAMLAHVQYLGLS